MHSLQQRGLNLLALPERFHAQRPAWRQPPSGPRQGRGSHQVQAAGPELNQAGGCLVPPAATPAPVLGRLHWAGSCPLRVIGGRRSFLRCARLNNQRITCATCACAMQEEWRRSRSAVPAQRLPAGSATGAHPASPGHWQHRCPQARTCTASESKAPGTFRYANHCAGQASYAPVNCVVCRLCCADARKRGQDEYVWIQRAACSSGV